MWADWSHRALDAVAHPDLSLGVGRVLGTLFVGAGVWGGAQTKFIEGGTQTKISFTFPLQKQPVMITLPPGCTRVDRGIFHKLKEPM